MSIFTNIFSKHPDSELVLIFDIGSSSVGGALIRTDVSAGPKIVFSTREPIGLEEQMDFDRFFTLATKSIESLSLKISKSGLGAPKKIFCVLSSPWYASQTRIVKFEKDTPFVVTSKVHDELLKKEIALFEQEYVTKYGHPEEKVRTLEVKNIRTKLNGYTTLEFLDLKAKSLEMTLFISISPETVLSRITEAISRHLHPRDVKFSSFVMASFVVTRDLFAHQENFLLIDLGGEVTDISMIKKSALRESISFPHGSNFIIRGLAFKLSTTLEEAKSLFSLYKDGHAAGDIAKKLDPVMNELKGAWLKNFQESLAKLSNDISIPSHIFMAIDKEFSDFFAQIIKTEQFNQYTLTESKFEVSFLGTEALVGTATFAGSIERDPFMIIEAIYINRFFN